MKLEINDVEGTAYQNFVDSIRDKETFRKYNSYLRLFLDLIPNEMYKQYLQHNPKSRDIQDLASAFTEIAQKNVKNAKDIIQAYTRNLKEQIDNNKLSPATAKNRLKPIKALMKSNDIEMSWYLVDKSLPKPGKSLDRAYKKEELQSMMNIATDLTDKAIIVLFSSGGFRVESWNYFTWDDVVYFYNKDDSFKGGALRVYRGDIEEYWCFITPEACRYLMLYREEWKSRFFRYPEKNEPLLISLRHNKPVRLGISGVKSRMTNIVESIGLRPKLKDGRQRHEIMIDHGFRKYFNTMLRRAKVNYLDKEDMMGHKVGLESHYERYQEEDFEQFPEYQKAIPFLTISDEERLRFEATEKQNDIEQLEEKNAEIQNLHERIDNLENGITARSASYKNGLLASGDDNISKGLITMVGMWFEMRATDDEKKKIWKKLKDNEDKKSSISDLLGDSDEMSWNNFYDSAKILKRK